jgi:hypothetical protein
MNIIAITLLLDCSLSHKLRQAIRASRFTTGKEIKKTVESTKRECEGTTTDSIHPRTS